MNGCTIVIDTPQSIKDMGNDYYEAGTDVFAEVFADSTLTHSELMQSALWAMYRVRMIASCDTPEWVQLMQDRLTLVGPKWDAIITKSLTEDLTDLHELYYQRVIRHEPITGTQGDVSVQSATGSDTVTNEDEDMPQTPIGSTDRYLSRRSTSTSTPSAVRTTKYTPNTQDTEDYTEDRDILAKTFSSMMDSYPGVLTGFARDFDMLFLQVLG